MANTWDESYFRFSLGHPFGGFGASSSSASVSRCHHGHLPNKKRRRLDGRPISPHLEVGGTGNAVSVAETVPTDAAASADTVSVAAAPPGMMPMSRLSPMESRRYLMLRVSDCDIILCWHRSRAAATRTLFWRTLVCEPTHGRGFAYV